MEELTMGKKHGKRVAVDKGFDPGEDVFSNPDLLNAYLDSLGVGSNQGQSAPSSSYMVSSNTAGNEMDEEDAGAAIADMLMEKMGGTPSRKRYDKPVTNTKTVETHVEKTTTTTVTSTATPQKKSRCNICLTRYVNGVKHLVIRDISGNAISVAVRSGEVKIKDSDVDAFLSELYCYCKFTGMPNAVYNEDEFVDRMLMKGISDADPDRYYFFKGKAFDDMILAYIIDSDEMNEFVEYIKSSLTVEEIPDTMLALVSMIYTMSPLLVDMQMTNWYLATYCEKNQLKDTLESNILEKVEQPQDANRVCIDFDDYDAYIEDEYKSIASYTSIVNAEESVGAESTNEIDSGVELSDPYNVEPFDPYNQGAANLQTERESAGASEDVKTFPENDVEHVTGDVSDTDVESYGDSSDIRESSEGSDTAVSGDTSDSESEEEKENVPEYGGDRGSSEFEAEEVQTGDGHPEITEVDPESFEFKEEEKEETNSMVVDRIVCK